MLAAVWAVTSLNALQVFMPLICAFHLALILAAAGIVASISTNLKAPFLTAALLALSPLQSLGTLEQLIGQVGGLAILCVAVGLLCRPPTAASPRDWALSVVPTTVAISALFVWYPESVPFLAVGMVLYLAAAAYKNFRLGFHLLALYIASTLIALVLLNKYVISAALFVLSQQVRVGMSAGSQEALLFPYFLIPSGIPAFWGLTKMAQFPKEPFMSIAILLGICFSILVLFLLKPQLKQLSPVAIFCAFMSALGIVMFFRNADYGLFKLSMFLQPFLAGVIAIAITSTSRNPYFQRLKLAFVTTLAIVNLYVQSEYVNSSMGGQTESTLIEVQDASQSKLYKQFSELFDKARHEFPAVLSDTPNPVLAKFQALYSRGEPLSFVGSDFFGSLTFVKSDTPFERINETYFLPRSAQDMAKQIISRKDTDSYSTQVLEGNTFAIPRRLSQDINDPWLISNGKGTIFNQLPTAFNDLDDSKTDSHELLYKWSNNSHNHLVFVNSSLGRYYYGAGGSRQVSFYQLERDPMFVGRLFSSLGRRLLFLVVRPTQQPRLVIELTSTVLKQFDSELPHPTVNGVDIPFQGRGSGRLAIPVPLTYVNGIAYLSIDMGRDGRPFPHFNRSLMMSLYGRNISLDPRFITTFGSNISLISDDSYQKIGAPANLKAFPEDLADTNLEYSGIYEDGWISEHAFFMLSPRPTDRSIRVKGLVPKIQTAAFSTNLQIMVDDQIISTHQVGIGNFDIRVPVDHSDGRHRVELVWDKFQRLPGEDGRTTAGKVEFIGYTD